MRIRRRGICPVCGKSEKLRLDGTLCRHRGRGGKKTAPYCHGEGQQPTRVVTTGGDPITPLAAEAVQMLAKPANGQGVTHVALVLDDSGSMSGIEKKAQEAFNRMIEPLRAEQDYLVTLYKFGSTIKAVYANKPANLVPVMESYYPNQSRTKLYDAIDRAIGGLKSQVGPNDSALVLVVTDGQNNWGTRDPGIVRSKVLELQSQGNWTFVASVPRHGVSTMIQSVGFPAGNVTDWDQTQAGAERMGQVNESSMSRYTQSRALGQRSVQNFYIHIGRQPVEQIKSQLNPMNGRYRKITVPRQCKIREAIEGAGEKFYPGCAYYELQKPEKVQDHKDMILELRDDNRRIGDLFGGPNTKQVVGVDDQNRRKVIPGNLGEWRVWVQSTSTNRNLLAQTQVLYAKR